MPFSLKQTESSLWIPAILCGMVGFLATTALWLLKLQEPVDLWLNNQLSSFLGQITIENKIATVWVFALGIIVACLVSLVMLDTPGKIRRSVVWISALFLVVGLAPLGFLFRLDFDVLFLACVILISGGCSLYWGAHHRMPCERIVKTKRISDKQKEDLLKTKRISLKALRTEVDPKKSQTKKL